MMPRSLKFGSFELPVHAAINLDTQYTPKHNRAYLTLANGDEIVRKTFSGLYYVDVSGNGIIPSGLNGLDFDAPMTVGFTKAMELSTTSTSVVLPAKRRSDSGSEPFAKAISASGKIIDVDMTLSTNTVTITPPSGVTVSQYVVYYFPELYGWVEEPVQSGGRGNDYSWSIRFREKA